MAAGDPLQAVAEFPLLEAIFGRRSRRFGAGMEIPAGPLAYKSVQPARPLDEREIDILAALACGSLGWNEGIPYRDGDPGLASYAFRLAGRSSPGGAGITTGELLYTNDSGTYIVRTRDIAPVDIRLHGPERLHALMQQVRRHTTRLSSTRVEIPRVAPHMHEHNFWNANVAGSTLFMPVLDLAQKMLGIMALLIQNRTTFVDEKTGKTCGDLTRFIRSGLIDAERKAPIGMVEASVFSTGSMENAIMAQNLTLGLQALGLGGWLFTGINPISLLGGYAEQGITGLGFRFAHDPRWLVPNPLGLDGAFEAWCPPYVTDMHAAARRVAEMKFGAHGAYRAPDVGAYSAAIRASAVPYPDALIECLGTVAQYVYDTYGRFPGSLPAVLITPYVQAHHLDTTWYDKYLGPESYLDTHRQHDSDWHHDNTTRNR